MSWRATVCGVAKSQLKRLSTHTHTHAQTLRILHFQFCCFHCVLQFVAIHCFKYFPLCSGTQLSNLKIVRSLEGLLLSLLFREVQNSLSFKFVWPTQPRTLLHAPCVRRYVHSSRKWCKLWRFFLLLLFFLF